MIETFTKDEFEAALPKHKETSVPLWEPMGFIQGEQQYMVPIDDKVGILIRSSIKFGGVSAAVGEDSIRAWLVLRKNGFPLGGKVTRWTTRQPGWQERLTEVLRTLWRWRKEVGDDDKGNPLGIFQVKNGKNKGKLFVQDNNKQFLRWFEP